MSYLILSCDGGGIRGYLSSLLLQQLDKDLKIFGTNNWNVDFYAGTSTGGLIALALAQGQSIDSIVNLYATKAPQIFTPADWQWWTCAPFGVTEGGGGGGFEPQGGLPGTLRQYRRSFAADGA